MNVVPPIVDHPHGISTVDAGFLGTPGFACVHLIVSEGRAAFVDTCTTHSRPLLLAALARKGLQPEAVDYVLATHVHLDHAGGAGTLMRALPNATLVVHPRGARHLIDPSKLIAGASVVYGADEVARNYGEIAPTPADRVIEAPEGFTLKLGGRTLAFLDTPGHARHHYCVWDAQARAVFTGDCFGLAYPWFTTAAGPWLVPSTSPVHFDPEAMHTTLDRLVALGASHAFLAHWGTVGDVPSGADDLRRRLDAMVELGLALRDVPERHARLVEGLWALYLPDLQQHGLTLREDRVRELLATDVELNAQGIAVWLARR